MEPCPQALIGEEKLVLSTFMKRECLGMTTEQAEKGGARKQQAACANGTMVEMFLTMLTRAVFRGTVTNEHA